MHRVSLGATGLRIHPLVFGTLPLGPLQASLPVAEGAALIRGALERGVNLVDTAELYETYPQIRQALHDFGGEAIIATKTHANTAATARAHVERALRELSRDTLDIVHLHGARIADPFTERREVIDELLALKEEGKIRHVGLSSHFICAVRAAARHPEIEVVHPLINRTGMGIMDGSAAEMAEAIAECAAAGKGIYAMKALAGGNLISSARSSFAYVMGLQGVHGVAVGMLSEAEVEGNVELFETGLTPEAVWEGLEARRRRITVMERFCKGCGACVPACTNNAVQIVEGKAFVDEPACILCGYCASACPDFLIRVL